MKKKPVKAPTKKESTKKEVDAVEAPVVEAPTTIEAGITIAIARLEAEQLTSPCGENTAAISALNKALAYLGNRNAAKPPL